MAGDWIKIERDLPHKPEVMQMAESLGIDELQVVGHLVLFWSWCDANMSLDCPDVNGTKRGLDRASCRDGMVDALVDVGWLSVREVDGHDVYTIPNFERHLSKSAKTRANEQRKKQRQRSCPDGNGTFVPTQNGTEPGPEKRREEKRRDKKKTTSSKKFTPPELNEVRAYCSERNNNVDAQMFLDHYQANGWMRGNSKIKDWKACVRTWEQRSKQEPQVWPQIVSFLSRDDLSQGYTERLTSQFGDAVAKVVKSIGAQKIAQANEFQLQTLSKQFEAEMKA